MIRVAAVPASHVYVQHIGRPDGFDGVYRLPDPKPAVRVTEPGQWWPPPALSASWIADHHDEFDLMHLQFGFDALG
ncbi:MAG: glycosyltransferase family 1 protein, partial [Actinomycetota bacterium]|nr:glycosyltransferase family 1 protein [Actinomycetota bacterium]